MFDLSNSIPAVPPVDWVRLMVVYLHLLASALALALVLGADWRILRNSFTLEALDQTARHASIALAALWFTGLALVYFDTAMNPFLIADNPKLLLKLVVVIALTLNGLVLHTVSFPILAGNAELRWSESIALCITGTLSTSHWVLAAFVGIARPLGQWPLKALLLGYVLYVVATLSVAITCVPLLRRHINEYRRMRRNSVEPEWQSQVDILLPLTDKPHRGNKAAGTSGKPDEFTDSHVAAGNAG